MEDEKSEEFHLCCLLPEGNLTAAAERYRDYLQTEIGSLPGAALLPVVPLAAGVRPGAPEPPRLSASAVFTAPVTAQGSVFLPLADPRILAGLVPSLEQSVSPDTAPLYPLFPGLFIGRIGDRELPPPPPELARPLRCTGFRLALVVYRLARPADGWWDIIEEERLWEVPVRKPRKNRNRPLAQAKKKR